jgi:hypothetical protein
MHEKDVIILDTGLSIGIIKNKKLMDKIRPSKAMLELATNAGRERQLCKRQMYQDII